MDIYAAPRLDARIAAFPFDCSILVQSVNVCTHCNSHTVFLRNLEIGQGGKKWVETEEGSCQLPFCSPRTVKAES